MNLEEKVDQLLVDVQETKSEIREVKVCLKGYNGNAGLLQTFEKHCDDDKRFKRNFYIVAGSVAGGGSLAAGIIKLLTLPS